MLLSLGFVGGWPGAIVAQQVLRHKTAKRTFRIRFWLSVAANIASFAWLALSSRSTQRARSRSWYAPVPDSSTADLALSAFAPAPPP